METVRITKVLENKVWIESDLHGSKHVMVQSQAPGSEPFQYATLYYDPRYTNNAALFDAAVTIAESIGGRAPFDERSRPLESPHSNPPSLGPE